MRRAVAICDVSTSNGTEGRSRATRRAVEPDDVKQMIALVSIVRTICAADAASASAVVASARTSVKWTRA